TLNVVANAEPGALPDAPSVASAPEPANMGATLAQAEADALPNAPSVASAPEPETLNVLAQAEPGALPDAPSVASVPELATLNVLAQSEPEPQPAIQVAQAEPEPAPQLSAQPLELDEDMAVEEAPPPAPPSATRRFFTTFFDFFKPPNTSGVVRTVETPTDIDPLKIKTPVRSAVGPREDDSVKAEAVAEQLRELKSSQGDIATIMPSTPSPAAPTATQPADGSTEEVKLASEPDQDTTEDDTLELIADVEPDPGDPDDIPDDLLALLGEDEEASELELTEESPLAFDEAEPDATPTDLAEDDPFAADTDVAEATSDALEGLEIPTDENPLAPTRQPPEGEDWAITELESALLPTDVVARPRVFNPTGKMLDGVALILGEEMHVGQEITESRLERMKEDTIHRPCAAKGSGQTMFCIETLFWPLDIEEYFQVDTIMYQGTRAIARYDGGRATNFHVLFGSQSFDTVINHFVETYGQPTKSIARTIAPLARPRQENPTMLWQSREPGTDQVVNLEVRKFDDARGGFPDTDRGVVLLYKSHSKPIFPELSQLELMVLRPDDQASASLGPSEPATPESVW
ncbi:MAG: hypothetical protein KAI73_07040, partial [Rhodospirillaceae bacterium]|nr:hypothetical protein [Rhodospirillaceae bacterium]